MKAICLRARGGPEALACEDAPQPTPGKGEVLVRIHAAGVIHAELGWVTSTRAGEPRPSPIIPGHEFSGEVAALVRPTAVSVDRLLLREKTNVRV
jgi:acryloyl-coenzyme A reductase